MDFLTNKSISSSLKETIKYIIYITVTDSAILLQRNLGLYMEEGKFDQSHKENNGKIQV